MIMLMFTAPTLTKAQSSSTTLSPAAASRLAITAPATATTGAPFTIAVTAYDPYNNVATGYRGTVHFTGSDSKAWLPANCSFVASDNGSHTFGNSVKLMTSGMQTITAMDVNNHSITGTATVQASPTPPAGFTNQVAIGASRGNESSVASDKNSGHVSHRLARQRSATLASLDGSQGNLTLASRARTIVQAHTALACVLSGLKGHLRAQVIADRLVDSHVG